MLSGGAQHRTLPFYQSKEMKILHMSPPRLGIESTSVVFTVARLPLCATTASNTDTVIYKVGKLWLLELKIKAHFTYLTDTVAIGSILIRGTVYNKNIWFLRLYLPYVNMVEWQSKIKLNYFFTLPAYNRIGEGLSVKTLRFPFSV